MWLSDMNKLKHDDARVKQVTDLGLKYNLLTDYTSFIAVDTVVRADGTQTETVKQPLPLPQGVGDRAVGDMMLYSGATMVSCDIDPHYSSRRLFSFGVNLDLFTITGSTDGGMINHFAEVDFLFMFPVFSHWNLYMGFGMGLFAPRARFGADLLLFDRRESGPILKLGGRYILTTWVADTPDDYENFDAKYDFARGFMGEAGLGWRFVSGRFAWQVVGLYLVGPMWPQMGGDDRAPGSVEPDGEALFHGGTISLTFEW
jgi:hypothetical protein